MKNMIVGQSGGRSEEHTSELQSGGPTAVINGSLYGVVSEGFKHPESIEHVYGMINGIEGFLSNQIMDMHPLLKNGDLELIRTTPGSYLGSCRYKLPEDLNNPVYPELFQKFEDYNIGYFFYIGGNDSMDTVSKLSRYAAKIQSPIRVIGVPKTMKEMKMYCDYFNEIGKRCQQNGMKFGYHNHAHEFQKVENQAVMLDYMIENTNPEYVFFQMDVYWIVRGQHSPVDYFNKYPGRFTVLHIKDDKEIGDSGMVGFDAIFRNAKVAGVKHIVAEIEGYSCPVEESVKKSLDYLLDAPFVKSSYAK